MIASEYDKSEEGSDDNGYSALEAWDESQELTQMVQFLKEQAVKTWEKQVLRREAILSRRSAKKNAGHMSGTKYR